MLVKDMFEKNGHNPSCGFAGDIVSYLYDEIDPAEKVKFETHLAGCTACDAELAAFSGVRGSITDWREADFGWLPSPDIVIPYEAVPEQPIVVETYKSTILTDLRRMFSFAPWPPAFAALGALAIVAGITYFAFTYLNKAEVDRAGDTNSKRPIASPTVETPKNTTVAIENEVPKQKVPDQIVTPRKDNGSEPLKTVATPTQPRKIAQPANVNANKPADKSTTPQKAPTLNNYTEVEDNTLRLADLFEEIDTRE